MKARYKSKTLWFSVVTAALAGLNQYSGQVTDPAQLNFVLMCTAIGNAVLRLVTTGPIGKEAGK